MSRSSSPQDRPILLGAALGVGATLLHLLVAPLLGLRAAEVVPLLLVLMPLQSSVAMMAAAVVPAALATALLAGDAPFPRLAAAALLLVFHAAWSEFGARGSNSRLNPAVAAGAIMAYFVTLEIMSPASTGWRGLVATLAVLVLAEIIAALLRLRRAFAAPRRGAGWRRYA